MKTVAAGARVEIDGVDVSHLVARREGGEAEATAYPWLCRRFRLRLKSSRGEGFVNGRVLAWLSLPDDDGGDPS